MRNYLQYYFTILNPRGNSEEKSFTSINNCDRCYFPKPLAVIIPRKRALEKFSLLLNPCAAREFRNVSLQFSRYDNRNNYYYYC